MTKHHKPIVQPNANFSWMVGDPDPAEIYMLSRETAWALLHRVRKQRDPEVVARVVKIAEKEGIAELAELWASSHAESLPGTLWRLYLLREVIVNQPLHASNLFQRGTAESVTIDRFVSGAREPADPQSLTVMIDEILRGVFSGDFAAALERAAAASAIFAAGAASLADLREKDSELDATKLTKQALRFDQFSRELTVNAGLWRSGNFE